MKLFSIKQILIYIAIPIVLDSVAIIMGLHGMAGGSYSEVLIDILFKIANWPSMLFKLSPLNRPDYELFDCLYPKILIFNIILWNIIGLIGNIFIAKLKKVRYINEDK
jgi:hypothetical protein